MSENEGVYTPIDHIKDIATDTVNNLATKYTIGQQEHGGKLWEKGGMLVAIEEELLDLVTYVHTLRTQIAATDPDLYMRLVGDVSEIEFPGILDDAVGAEIEGEKATESEQMELPWGEKAIMEDAPSEP